MKYKIDLHVHTNFSKDSNISIDELYKKSILSGINVIAITDHNTVKGAMLAKDRIKDIEVIIGEEILTSQGEIIGLFLQEEIKPYMSASETIKQIKAQKGLVYLPHPFSFFRSALKNSAKKTLLDEFDIIESFNAKSLPYENFLAREFATKNRKVVAAGSDAHSIEGFGETYSYVETELSVSRENLVKILSEAKIVGKYFFLENIFYKISASFQKKKGVIKCKK
ncbi:PHP domain protein [Thermodesulfobium narugense DSM 14796]|uniref:PHP domain protein n=1 Tax=Thermodesulfobium narugense DSM 14796 TaxID=747365 RepID=M1E804_9BACT|nr:PHP domain-containing protein [Thermodesulfobium narugense]AEE14219.1 PHP domain protein [Thermodesulfobium narugense DSM 14796]